MDDDIVMLKPGDRCPLCGQPIKSHDPDVLALLTEIKHYLSATVTIEMIDRVYERRREIKNHDDP